MKKSRLIPLVIIAVAALIVFLLVATKPTPPTQETKEKSWLISTQKVELGLATPKIKLLGTVESPFDTTISSTITADIQAVPGRDGTIVQKGDVIIELDKREIKLTLQQRKADVAELKAQIEAEKNRYQSDLRALEEEKQLLEIAEKGVSRQAKLQASNLVAQERYDAAESSRAQQALSINNRKLNIADHPSRLRQLHARLLRAETALRDTEIDVDKASVKAPFDGVITDVAVAPGERVQTGQALVSLYDTGNTEIRAQIPDRYVSLIQSALLKGKQVSATTYHYGNTIELSLERLSGQANLKSGGVDALFVPKTSNIGDTANSGLILNHSLEVQVNLPQINDVYLLPSSAIYGTNRVYKVEDGRLQSVNINIKGYSYDDSGKQSQVIVSSKQLASGDEVTSTQLPNAISGLKVTTRGEAQ